MLPDPGHPECPDIETQTMLRRNLRFVSDASHPPTRASSKETCGSGEIWSGCDIAFVRCVLAWCSLATGTAHTPTAHTAATTILDVYIVDL